MRVLAGTEAEIVLRNILGSHAFEGWRGFMDGHWAVLESPHASITMDDMRHLNAWNVDQVGAVFRADPTPGVYLRCRLLGQEDPSWHIKQMGGF